MKVAWYPPDVVPKDGTPVIAEYRAWTQTVWYYDGDWRYYPNTSGHAYVDRWRFKKALAIEAATAGETTKIGSTEGESAGPQGQRPKDGAHE